MRKTLSNRLLALVICVVFCISFCPVKTMAAENNSDISFEESLAVGLKHLGLFEGISDTDFGLKSAPTRADAVVMLIRMLGKENEVLSGSFKNPFTDVPSWASPYVAYAYENGLTKGISDNLFGPDEVCGINTFLTFILRALGYSEISALNDFTWQYPYTLAARCGILPYEVNADEFLRADVVLISYAALTAELKNSAKTLAEKLIDENAFSKALYDTYIDKNAFAGSEAYQNTLAGLGGYDSFRITSMLTASGCSVVCGSFFGAMHSSSKMVLVWPDGSAKDLPLPQAYNWGGMQLPDRINFSEDRNTLYYQKTFYENLYNYFVPGQETLIHEKGTYNYTIDLITGNVSLTITD